MTTGPASEANSRGCNAAVLAHSDRSRQDRLRQAIDEFYAAVDAGQTPDRSALLAKYADIAEELDDCLSNLDFIKNVAPQLAEKIDAQTADEGSAVSQRVNLGDFRIIREIGRGGMGVVYEAEQLSLGRRMALKVLPFAAMFDKQQLKRFKNEARAAASLDHPNIVAVHSVGEERGVHYYAMQLVDGQSLAQILADLRAAHGIRRHPLSEQDGQTVTCAMTRVDTPPADALDSSASGKFAESIGPPNADTQRGLQAGVSTIPAFASGEYFHAIARLAEQAARALDHAHQNGILHRDIKPGNLLVDGAGNLQVTDFGLARIEADAGMTMTGDLLGTLAYMSPEQALAKRVVVDHRTDIYSLGVTLYELLTLHPAYAGQDRQELLKKIAFDEPRRPRQVSSRIPHDLETIVCKAIEKSPDERYATAEKLADDLQRFLNDQPIVAQPPGLIDRSVKWARRHKAWTVGLFAVLAISVILLGASTAAVGVAQRRTAAQRNRFLSERDMALGNLYVADVRLAQEEWNNAHLAAVQKLLNAHLPAEGQPDFRGWEWYYLHSLCHRDLATYRGHSADVVSVAWSPDGRRLATGSEDFTVKIWDVASAREVATLRGHKDVVKSVAWSPDGQRLASSGWDDAVRVWDVATEQSTLEISAGMKWPLRNVVWSPDGTKLASSGGPASGSSEDVGLVKVWDAKTGAELLRMKGPSGLVWSVAWSPDGKRLASVGGHGSQDIRIWDAESGRLLREVSDAHRHSIVSVAWSPDGQQLATSSIDQHVKVWNTESWECSWIADAHQGEVKWVSWSPDGKTLATAGVDGAVRLWDARQGRLKRTLLGHLGGVESVDWRFDGKRLASASADHTVKIWDPNQEQASTSVRANGRMAWYSDGGHSASLVRETGKHEGAGIQIFNAATGMPVKRIAHEFKQNSQARRHAWSANGRRVAVVCASPDGQVIKILERATGTEVFRFSLPSAHAVEVRSMEWSPDAGYVAAAINDETSGSAMIWDLATGQMIAKLSCRDGAVGSVAWSPDGSRLAVTTWKQFVLIFETGSWREIARFSRHPGININSAGGDRMAAWSPDGHTLAAGTARGWVIFWDTSTWRETLSFSAHTAPIRSLAFNPNGSRLATASDDQSVKVWDVHGGKQLLTLHHHPPHDLRARMDFVAWSPDGTCLLSSSGNAHWIWDASAMMNK